MIGDDVKITVVAVKGDHVRIGVDAPKRVSIHRLEVYEEIKRANVEAAEAASDKADLDQLASLFPKSGSDGGKASGTEDPPADT
jgi:carbon storage regulator